MDGEYIRIMRTLSGFTQRELARKIGVDHTTINRIEKGHSKPQSETIARLNKVFDELIDSGELEIPNALTLPSEEGSIPVLGVADAGVGIEANDKEFPVGFSDEYVSRPHGLRDKNAFAVKVGQESMSMFPALKPGMLCVVSPNLECQSGDLALVKTKDGDTRIKEVRFNMDSITMLSYQNNQSETLAKSEIEWCYPVVWWRRPR